MQLDDPAIAVPRLFVDRDDRLSSDLEIGPAPNNPGLDSADRLAGDPVYRGRERYLDERDHLAERRTQADVLNAALQVREAVLEGEPVIDTVRIGRASAFGLGRKIETEI